MWCEHCERQPNGRMKYCSPECKERMWEDNTKKQNKKRKVIEILHPLTNNQND